MPSRLGTAGQTDGQIKSPYKHHFNAPLFGLTTNLYQYSSPESYLPPNGNYQICHQHQARVKLVKLSDSTSHEHGNKISPTKVNIFVKLIKFVERKIKVWSLISPKSKSKGNSVGDAFTLYLEVSGSGHVHETLQIFMMTSHLPVISTFFSILQPCFL